MRENHADNRNLQDRIAVGLFAVICAAVYFNSLNNSFVFDDISMLKSNVYIKDLRYLPLFLRGIFSSFPVPKGMFRPLLMWSFSFNYFFSGPAPLGYHIINVLLHFLNGVLLYSIIRFFFKKAPFGLILLITSLFLVHPMNAEAVTYIASRSDLLVTLFMGLGILAYVKRKYASTLLFYSASLLTKETAIAFSLFIILYDFIYDRKVSKKKVMFYIGMAALTAFYLFYRKIIFGGVGNIYPVRSLYSNILTQSLVTLFYLRLFLFPWPLSVHHDLPILNSVFNPLAVAGFAFIIAVIILILLLRKKWPVVSFGLGWILAGVAPKFYGTLNVVASEHHFYLSSIGVYLILVVLTQGLYLKWRRYYIYLAGGLIGICAVLTWFRNLEWRDALKLWRVEAKRNSSSAIVHTNLGFEYLKAGLYQEAQEEFKKVLSLSAVVNEKINVGINIANIRRIEGKYEEALAELEKVRKLNPNYSGVYNEIGIIYESMRRLDEAERAFKEGLRLYPNSAHLNTNLGFLYTLKKQTEQAQEYFQRAIECDPDFSLAYFGLGQVLEVKGDNEAAEKAYEKSIRIDPAYAKAHYTLGTLYAIKGDSRALRELKEAVRLEPTFAAAHNNLAVLYASMEPARLELAKAHAQKALAFGYKVEEEFLRKIGLK